MIFSHLQEPVLCWLRRALLVSQDLDVKCGRDYPHEGMPTETQGMAKMALDIMFLNSAIDATGALEAPLCPLVMPSAPRPIHHLRVLEKHFRGQCQKSCAWT